MKRKTNPRTIGLIVALALCAVAVVWAQSARRVSQSPSVRASAARGNQAPAVAMSRQVMASRRPLAYYTGGVRADLFGDPPAPEAPPTIPVPPSEPIVLDPFTGYSLAGLLQMGEHPVALVESSTKEGTYLKVGDSFVGGTVTKISSEAVEVKVGKSNFTLNKRSDYKITSLDKNAPYLNQAAPGAMGMAGGPGGRMGMMGQGGSPFPGFDQLPQQVQDRIRQRMGNMTPEQMRDTQNRFMNRSFDSTGGGGGGGGRRRGGGGGGGGFGMNGGFMTFGGG